MGVTKETVKHEALQYGKVIIGGAIFAAGVNLFIVPLSLYSCGVVGIAQIIRTILVEYAGLSSSVDIAGFISLLINAPLFIMAYRTISRTFFIKTALNVLAQTVTFTLVPIPGTPVIDDMLTSCIIGGLISGYGIGMALRASGCGGGLDILGVYLTKKGTDISVGKINLIVNAVVYAICAFLFDIPTAIYSIIYMACFSLVMDKIHYQNINMTAMIFTKNSQIQQEILKQLGRGVTYWTGAGAYTQKETHVLVTVINKYEESHVKRIVEELDPNAFVIFNEGVAVEGNFERRL